MPDHDVIVILQKKSESSGSDAPLNTCVTFVDRPGSKQATAATDTEVALAQLYAHVQNMPESAKKRKLLKQVGGEKCTQKPFKVR